MCGWLGALRISCSAISLQGGISSLAAGRLSPGAAAGGRCAAYGRRIWNPWKKVCPSICTTPWFARSSTQSVAHSRAPVPATDSIGGRTGHMADGHRLGLSRGMRCNSQNRNRTTFDDRTGGAWSNACISTEQKRQSPKGVVRNPKHPRHKSSLSTCLGCFSPSSKCSLILVIKDHPPFLLCLHLHLLTSLCKKERPKSAHIIHSPLSLPLGPLLVIVRGSCGLSVAHGWRQLLSSGPARDWGLRPMHSVDGDVPTWQKGRNRQE